MAADFFLKLDGIKGESKDSSHKDEIEVQSFSFGATQATNLGSGGGGGAGKVQFNDIHFSTRMNKASATLLQNCASGKHIPTAEITARKAGEKPLEYLKIKLTDVLVSSYQAGGGSGGGEVISDQFSLAFAAINVQYFEQDAKGAALAANIASWDLKKNAKA